MCACVTHTGKTAFVGPAGEIGQNSSEQRLKNREASR